MSRKQRIQKGSIGHSALASRAVRKQGNSINAGADPSILAPSLPHAVGATTECDLPAAAGTCRLKKRRAAGTSHSPREAGPEAECDVDERRRHEAARQQHAGAEARAQHARHKLGEGARRRCEACDQGACLRPTKRLHNRQAIVLALTDVKHLKPPARPP